MKNVIRLPTARQTWIELIDSYAADPSDVSRLNQCISYAVVNAQDPDLLASPLEKGRRFDSEPRHWNDYVRLLCAFDFAAWRRQSGGHKARVEIEATDAGDATTGGREGAALARKVIDFFASETKDFPEFAAFHDSPENPYFWFLPAHEFEKALEQCFSSSNPGSLIAAYMRAIFPSEQSSPDARTLTAVSPMWAQIFRRIAFLIGKMGRSHVSNNPYADGQQAARILTAVLLGDMPAVKKASMSSSTTHLPVRYLPFLNETSVNHLASHWPIDEDVDSVAVLLLLPIWDRFRSVEEFDALIDLDSPSLGEHAPTWRQCHSHLPALSWESCQSLLMAFSDSDNPLYWRVRANAVQHFHRYRISHGGRSPLSIHDTSFFRQLCEQNDATKIGDAALVFSMFCVEFEEERQWTSFASTHDATERAAAFVHLAYLAGEDGLEQLQASLLSSAIFSQAICQSDSLGIRWDQAAPMIRRVLAGPNSALLAKAIQLASDVIASKNAPLDLLVLQSFGPSADGARRATVYELPQPASLPACLDDIRKRIGDMEWANLDASTHQLLAEAWLQWKQQIRHQDKQDWANEITALTRIFENELNLRLSSAIQSAAYRDYMGSRYDKSVTFGTFWKMLKDFKKLPQELKIQIEDSGCLIQDDSRFVQGNLHKVLEYRNRVHPAKDGTSTPMTFQEASECVALLLSGDNAIRKFASLLHPR